MIARQDPLDVDLPDRLSVPLTALYGEVAVAGATRRHAHASSQILYTLSGVLTVEAETRHWRVPAGSALWVPAGMDHLALANRSSKVSCIFADPKLAILDPGKCKLFIVQPLLRELFLKMTVLAQSSDQSSRLEHLMAVICDEVMSAPSLPACFPSDRDPRIERLMNEVIANPSKAIGLSDWGEKVGASERTLNRLFLDELGMPFANWRRSLHLQIACDRLKQGEAVEIIAYDLGYTSTSAFIAMFRRSMADTPAHYGEMQRRTASGRPLA